MRWFRAHDIHTILIHREIHIHDYNHYWGEPEWAPTLIMTMASARDIMLSIYLSIFLFMYRLPRVCRTLVPEIRVRLEMLCVIRYIDMLTCIYNCTQLNSKDNWSYSCLLSRLCTDTWYNHWFSLLKQWICSCPATCQHMPLWIKNNRCTAVLWRSYRQNS